MSSHRYADYTNEDFELMIRHNDAQNAGIDELNANTSIAVCKMNGSSNAILLAGYDFVQDLVEAMEKGESPSLDLLEDALAARTFGKALGDGVPRKIESEYVVEDLYLKAASRKVVSEMAEQQVERNRELEAMKKMPTPREAEKVAGFEDDDGEV